MKEQTIISYAIKAYENGQERVEMFEHFINKLFGKKHLNKSMYRALYSVHRFSENEGHRVPEDDFAGLHFACFYYMQASQSNPIVTPIHERLRRKRVREARKNKRCTIA